MAVSEKNFAALVSRAELLPKAGDFTYCKSLTRLLSRARKERVFGFPTQHGNRRPRSAK